jgi:hypothetical protein
VSTAGEESGGVESSGEETSNVERSGEETGRDFEFWDESETTWSVLLFICSKISAAVLN